MTLTTRRKNAEDSKQTWKLRRLDPKIDKFVNSRISRIGRAGMVAGGGALMIVYHARNSFCARQQ